MISNGRISLKKMMASMILCLGLALAACGDPNTKTECAAAETIGKCTDVVYCCTADSTSATCHWEANGKTYSCSNQTDCAQAAMDLQADCQ